MPTRNERFDLDAIDLLLDEGVVAYQRALARIVRDATTGLLLSQFWYWSKRLGEEREGWFWKTQDEIFEETVLTRREQETARRNLRDLRILEERRAGVPPKLWFRINRAVVKQLLQANASRQNGGFGHSEKSNSAIPECADRPPQSARKRPFNTKTTPKTTSKITAADPPTISPSVQPDAVVDAVLLAELLSHEMNRADAIRLAQTMPAECRRQLEFLPYLSPRTNPGGWLREAIENQHGAPPGYQEAKSREANHARQKEKAALQTAQQAHEVAHRAAYLSYLGVREAELRTSHPEPFAAFIAQEAGERDQQGPGWLTPSMLQRLVADYDRPEQHYRRLKRFFSQLPGCAILDFWDWDSTTNPESFSKQNTTNGSNYTRSNQSEGRRWKDDNSSQPRGMSRNGGL